MNSQLQGSDVQSDPRSKNGRHVPGIWLRVAWRLQITLGVGRREEFRLTNLRVGDHPPEA